MKHCANDSCPDLVERGLRGEYRDLVSVCPRCGVSLSEGELLPPEPDEWADLVPVSSFTHVASAHVARATLENAGIQAFVVNENLATMQWMYTTAIGGVQVLVDPDDAAAALETLSSMESADMASDADAADHACPRCVQGVLEPSDLGFRSRALSLLLGLPFVLWRKRVKCSRCGHSFRESRSGSTSEAM